MSRYRTVGDFTARFCYFITVRDKVSMKLGNVEMNQSALRWSRRNAPTTWQGLRFFWQWSRLSIRSEKKDSLKASRTGKWQKLHRLEVWQRSGNWVKNCVYLHLAIAIHPSLKAEHSLHRIHFAILAKHFRKGRRDRKESSAIDHDQASYWWLLFYELQAHRNACHASVHFLILCHQTLQINASMLT